jgi:uncharacterized Fe-S cluster protein YjdI
MIAPASQRPPLEHEDSNMSRDPIEKHYRQGELTVVWKPSVCQHSMRCVNGLPDVFDRDKRPWIDMTGAPTDEIAAQVRRCPSGALSILGEEPTVDGEIVAPAPCERVPVRGAKGIVDGMTVTRELLLHRLHEAAELEHTLMCMYLYTAFSLRQGTEEGLTPEQAEATARWRRAIIDVAVEEMGHLAAVWNITCALGGSPRFGRANFPIDPGLLPASVVVKLAPFSEATLQHCIHLERPTDSQEPEGRGFEPELSFVRGARRDGLTPMAVDYLTVGALYETIESNLREFVAAHGEDVAFSGDPALQLSQEEVALDGAQLVVCSKSALAALGSIVEQGEGSHRYSESSHFARFLKIREELAAMRSSDPSFEPAHPAATNPALRRPLRATDRIWIEDEEAARTVDVANAGYALMLRLLAYSYVLPRTSSEKQLAVGLSIQLMHGISALGERAARLPAGASHPGCNAGMSFTTLRDTAPLPPGLAARFSFMERFQEIAAAAASLDTSDRRAASAARVLASISQRANKSFAELA